jgi:hypothetical protein
MAISFVEKLAYINKNAKGDENLLKAVKYGRGIDKIQDEEKKKKVKDLVNKAFMKIKELNTSKTKDPKKKIEAEIEKFKKSIGRTKWLTATKYMTRSGLRKTTIEKDAVLSALPKGKRISRKTGKPYWENRANRSDVKQPPKTYPKLAEGGVVIDTIYYIGLPEITSVDKNGRKSANWKYIVIENDGTKRESIAKIKFSGDAKDVKANTDNAEYVTQKEFDKLYSQMKFAKGGGVGKLKIGKDDFSFLLKLTDKELEKRLDLVRKQQKINAEQYFDAKKKGNNTSKIEESGDNLMKQENAIIQARIKKNFAKGGGVSEHESKFEVDDVVYNKKTKTIGIVRIEDDKHGEVKTDADGNVDVDDLEHYNPLKYAYQGKADVAPSTKKEIEERMLWKPFASKRYAKGGAVGSYKKEEYMKPIGKVFYSFYIYNEDGERDDILYFDSFQDAKNEYDAYAKHQKEDVIYYNVQFETNFAPFSFETGVVTPNGKRIAQIREGVSVQS